MFFRSTSIGATYNEVGLFELFLSHLNSLSNLSVFDKIQVIVPNHAMSAWMKDRVTAATGICANLDFVVLPGIVIENIYIANNPDAILFDFKQAKYIIYDYLCKNKLITPDAKELNYYLYENGELNKFRVYQLASQLQQIIHEYVYLRTTDMLNLDKAKFPNWQKEIIRYLLTHIDRQKTFLDIYTFFANIDVPHFKIPKHLFIFGLTSIYPSQLQIINNLAKMIDIYWYYQPCSYEYYGDLLSDMVRTKLEQKLLNEPELRLDDLYLTAGNPLLANLGQQSREFIELLQANDITVYDFKPEEQNLKLDTMLSIVQNDIRTLKYRIASEQRINQNNDYYVEPIALLPESYNIKINSCHNRMREVQVMFNEIAKILNNHPHVQLSDILVVAPDIDNYAAYINAVFDNEELANHQKIPYNITGNRRHKDYKILDTIRLIINAPYNLTVSYFIDILNQIGMSEEDINWIKHSLLDNATHFGYTETDYVRYGYVNYPVHGFRQWINNLVLGGCLNESMFEPNMPLYVVNQNKFCPYDNIDSNQLLLCERIIGLVNLLENLRNIFYIDDNSLKELTIAEAHDTLTMIYNHLASESTAGENFLGTLLALNIETPINLNITTQLIDDYTKDISSSINLDGAITCASLGYMRNIPFAYIYVLGLNFGEFPSGKNPNQLSVLAKIWHLADRNYNIEDKQIFLDTILSARVGLYLSYIGRKETDNSEIKPSPVLGLLINTIQQSFMGEMVLDNILTKHSLHPFYNNQQNNYSSLWNLVANQVSDKFQDNRWDFNNALKLSSSEFIVDIGDISNTFLYTNYNLYKTLGISTYNQEIELEDSENLVLYNRYIAKTIYPYLQRYSSDLDSLYEYLTSKGVIGYQSFGRVQFDYYNSLYQFYRQIQGKQLIDLNLKHSIYRQDDEFILTINGSALLENDNIIITPDFADIKDKPLAKTFNELPYKLKINAMVYAALVAHSLAKTVIIRQINSTFESRDFIIQVNDNDLSNKILAYYLRSRNNPVLIHKAGIEEYISSISATNKDGSPKYNLDQIHSRVYAKYNGTFNNYDLDNIKQDVIFSSIADNYFEFIKDYGSINDITNIGLLLSKVSGS